MNSYAVCSFFWFVHRLGFKILNWEPKPDSNPRRRAPGGGPLTRHCTGPLRPNGQTLAHASSSCGWGMSRPRHAYVSADFRRWNWKTPGQAYSHFTPENPNSRYIAKARARVFPRARRAHLRGHGSLLFGPTLWRSRPAQWFRRSPFAASSSCPPLIDAQRPASGFFVSGPERFF